MSIIFYWLKTFFLINETLNQLFSYKNHNSPDHKSALVERNGREVKNSAEDRLHDGNDEAAMDDELTKGGRTLVTIAAVNEQQARQVWKLCDREICCQTGLPPLQPSNTNTCIPINTFAC